MFKRLSIVFLLVIALSVTSSAQKWEFDKVHSTIGFSVKHLVISRTTGKFDDYSGQVMFDDKNFEKGLVDITIQVASINTDNQTRDDHLRSGDFFDIEKYPTMKFKSKKIIKGNGDNFRIIGDLTIKEVTKEVILDCEYNGMVTGPYGKTRAGFTAKTEINRQDFHVSWNNKLKDGSLVVGNEIIINLEIEIVKEG